MIPRDYKATVICERNCWPFLPTVCNGINEECFPRRPAGGVVPSRINPRVTAIFRLEARPSDDKAAIETKTQALVEVSGKMAERIYAKKGGGANAGGGADSASAASDGGDDSQGGQGGKSEGDVVDAEFEEVKEDGK